MRRRVLARGATGGAAAPLGGWAGGRAAPSARRGLSAGPSLPAVRGPGRAGLAKHITASRLRRRFAPLYASTEPSSSTSTSAEPSDEGDKAAQGEPAEPSGSDGPGGPPTRWDRLRFYLAGLVLSPVRLVRLVVNLAILSFLFKLVPASGVVDMETIVVHVPYSDFMRKVEKDQVMNLQVDGNYHTYRLKNERAELRRMASAVEAQGSKTKLLSFEKIKRINYVTVRPQNMNTPYDTLMRNNVQFGARTRGSAESSPSRGTLWRSGWCSPWFPGSLAAGSLAGRARRGSPAGSSFSGRTSSSRTSPVWTRPRRSSGRSLST